MWQAAEVFQFVLDILELICHWRVWLLVFVGLLLALLLQRVFPGQIGSWATIAFPVTGLVVGLIWEWKH